MLYDSKWNPISLANLISWLEAQPPDVEYCFKSNGECLIAQYVKSLGFANVSVGGSDCHYNWRSGSPVELTPPPSFCDISQGHPRTFRAALDRARRLPLI